LICPSIDITEIGECIIISLLKCSKHITNIILAYPERKAGNIVL
jgi:hypothetical protein